MEPAKLANKTPDPKGMLPPAFITDFFKLFKTYQKIKQEFKDQSIEEQLEIHKINKDEILYLDLTDIPKEKIKLAPLSKMISCFPNLVQINLSGTSEILESEHKMSPILVQTLNNLKNLKSLNLGNCTLNDKDLKKEVFFNNIIDFESTGLDEETKVNYVEKIKDLTTEKNTLHKRIDDLEVQKATMKKRIDDIEEKFEKLSDFSVGTISPFGGKPNQIPKGYLFCNGQEISRNYYQKLFDVIGTNFGNGNGSTTFNVPDMRGNFMRGTDYGAGRDPDRGYRTSMRNGNSGDEVGSWQEQQLFSHAHSIPNNWINNDGYILNAWGQGNAAEVQCSGAYYHYDRLSSMISLASYTENSGGNETRPKNVNVNFIIKF